MVFKVNGKMILFKFSKTNYIFILQMKFSKTSYIYIIYIALNWESSGLALMPTTPETNTYASGLIT